MGGAYDDSSPCGERAGAPGQDYLLDIIYIVLYNNTKRGLPGPYGLNDTMNGIGTYILIGLGSLLAYEALRAVVLAAIRSRLYRSVREYLDDNRVRLDRYKFMQKVIIKHELMNDTEVHQGIIDHAREKDAKIRDVQDQVEGYIEEIVPFFNLLSYYKLGYWVANSFLNMIYEVVIDRENAEKLKKIPPDSVVVFVMNHRSNIDYILVAYMLARQISLSYAVGEWARVWPLEYIFKSFGAYFIRRRYREKLYHMVLEKYVQLISLQGVTQGIFLEGGLSRDGRLRIAKIGILDYIIGIKKNPDFARELVFVPAAINYDWVLEDRTLIQEWRKGKEKSGFKDHMATLFRVIGKGPMLLFFNLARYASGRLKQHGSASVSFGDPVFLSEFLAREKKNLFTLPREERLARVQEFADGLLHRIGKAIPVTPVCITARALVLIAKERLTRTELTMKVAELRRACRAKGGRLVHGRAFESSRKIINGIEREKGGRTKELVDFEEDLLEFEQSLETVEAALDVLVRRKIVAVRQGRLAVNSEKSTLLEYYSNSLDRLLG